MDEDGKKLVCTKRSDDRIEEVDRLSDLPDSLIFQILLSLSMKDVVKTSVLSKRWGVLWRYVPGLDLSRSDSYGTNIINFVDRFLGFDSESCLQKFKWEFDGNYVDCDHINRWINIAIKRSVQHLYGWGRPSWRHGEIPPTIYTCESLVSLQLSSVVLPSPEFVYLPSLKDMNLSGVCFANDLAFEMLISGCPVLENLNLWRVACDNVDVLRVCSKSLLKFTLSSPPTFLNHEEVDRVVAIDAPRLEYLEIHHCNIASFIVQNTSSLVQLVTNLPWDVLHSSLSDDLVKRNMIGSFLIMISSVKIMNIYWDVLEIIHGYSRYEQIPLFRNLSFLSIIIENTDWKILPIFLERCPNLKSLHMTLWYAIHGGLVVPGPRQFLTSLEYFTIIPKMKDSQETLMELVGYILENSPVLKNLTLYLRSYVEEKDHGIIRKKLLSLPRLSTLCKIVVRRSL